MSWMNFNTAEQQTGGDVIPKGTIAKVHMKIRPGGYDDTSAGWTGGYATRSDKSGSVYLDCEFTVLSGPFAKRKVWSLVGLMSPKGPAWGNMGRAFLRAAVESAKGINPNDESEAAQKARMLSGIGDLDGLEFVVKIDVEEDTTGQYGDKNVIRDVITPGHKSYAATMAGEATAAPAPAPKAANGGGVPAWAQ